MIRRVKLLEICARPTGSPQRQVRALLAHAQERKARNSKNETVAKRPDKILPATLRWRKLEYLELFNLLLRLGTFYALK